MANKPLVHKKVTTSLTGIAAMSGLYLISRDNYLLFHSLVELFSVVIAGGIFMIAWNSRRFLDNNYLVFIGSAYIFIGIIDLLHTLAYKDMGVFPGSGANLPTQLWIAARLLQSLSLLAAPIFINRKLDLRYVFAGYATVTVLLLLSIFNWKVFPACFVDGIGLTLFKQLSEYAIVIILCAALWLMLRKRQAFNPDVLHLLAGSIVLLICTELAFTTYNDVYGLNNLVGHFFKTIAFYLIYKAMIETGLSRPYDLLLRELRQAKELLEQKVVERTTELYNTIDLLQEEIIERELTEEELLKSSEEIRNLYDQAPCGYHSLDKDGVFIQINDTELQWLGYSREEVVGKLKFSDLLTKSSLQTFQASFPRFKELGREQDIEFDLVRKDGSILPVLLSATAIADLNGNYALSRSTIYDITERKRLENNILRMNRLYRVLSATNHAIVHNTEKDTLFQDICRSAVEHGGFRMAWIGLVDTETGVIKPAAWDGANNGYLDEIRISAKNEPEGCGPTGLAIREGTYYICNDFMNDPSTLPWHDKARERGFFASAAIALKSDDRVIGAFTIYAGEPNFFDEGLVKLLIEMAMDISFALGSLDRVEALRKKDQMLLLQSRQAAMGEMIGNIAHQWRQPLNTLGLTIQALPLMNKMNACSQEYLDEMAAKVMRIITHMSQTIDDFRNYFRPDKEVVQFNAKEAVTKAVSFIEASFRELHIDIEVAAADAPVINGFPNEYSQVLLNILINARDALADRKIATPKVVISIGTENGKAVVTISDNAGGIPETIMDKIFEPYFTTKGSEKGTGIGLFMSKSIIEKNMNGHITARNIDNGAEFRIAV